MPRPNKSVNIKSGPSLSSRPWVSIHTYTPASHENLLKQLSIGTLKHNEVKTLKKELNNLKVELKKANLELQLKEDRIKMLEAELFTNIAKSNDTIKSNKQNSKSGLIKDQKLHRMRNDNSGEILSQHFTEVMSRHKKTLRQKDEQIRELQSLLAQYQNRYSAAPEEEIKSHDLSVKFSANSQYNAGPLNDKSSEGVINNKNKQQPAKFIKPILKKPEQKTIAPKEKPHDYLSDLPDVESIDKYFLKKLNFELELDALYWEFEQKRFLMFQNNNDCDFDQRRAKEEEFERFRQAREGLLHNMTVAMGAKYINYPNSARSITHQWQ